MNSQLRSILALLFLVATLSIPVVAAPLIIEFSAEARRPASNDLVRASVFAEGTGATPGELARQINASLSEALKTIRTYSSVKVQSGGTSTYPVHSKNGKIESWRMRSELSIESSDTVAISELLGKLQNSLGVSHIAMLPSPETRKKAEQEAMLDAITAFRERARILADAMGKPYAIKHLSVNTGSRDVQPIYRGVAKAMSMEAAPMPVEAGESQVSATVSGQIELN